jgi:hypothetical protein
MQETAVEGEAAINEEEEERKKQMGKEARLIEKAMSFDE